MNRSVYILQGKKNVFSKKDILGVFDSLPEDLHKGRLIYTPSGILSSETIPYKLTKKLSYQFKELPSNFSYSLKYENRILFAKNYNRLVHPTEDILYLKKGFLTDSTYANILFEDEHGLWYSPSHYLLKGTYLSQLEKEGRVQFIPIHYKNLNAYVQFKPINALLELQHPWVSVQNISSLAVN